MGAVTGIILAGGRSSRIGHDKAQLLIDGIPLLRRVFDSAAQCCTTVYVVTPWADRYREILPPDCHFVHETSRSDSSMSQGPLIGFIEGLAHVETEWTLLLACDLPRLQAEVFQSWVSELDAVDDSIVALLPRHSKGWEPLCGFYRQRCLPELQAYREAGGRSFQRWLLGQTVQTLHVPDTRMLLNCNTLHDLEQVMDTRTIL
ncbi:MAG: molybdenum cofactor guanylyltransferase [Elainellaceae cyanobacterium]